MIGDEAETESVAELDDDTYSEPLDWQEQLFAEDEQEQLVLNIERKWVCNIDIWISSLPNGFKKILIGIIYRCHETSPDLTLSLFCRYNFMTSSMSLPSTTFPASSTIAAGLVEIEPGGMREMLYKSISVFNVSNIKFRQCFHK